MSAGLISALGGAAASVVSQGLNYALDSYNREADYSDYKRRADLQNQYTIDAENRQNEEYWKRLLDQREYDSPSALMARLAAAGINPKEAVSGSFNTAQQAQSPTLGSTPSPSVSGGRGVPFVNLAGDASLGISMLKSLNESDSIVSQRNYYDAQVEKSHAEVLATLANARNLDARTKATLIDNATLDARNRASLNYTEAQLNEARQRTLLYVEQVTDAQFKNTELNGLIKQQAQIALQKAETEIEEMNARIAQIRADTSLTPARKALMISEYKVTTQRYLNEKFVTENMNELEKSMKEMNIKTTERNYKWFVSDKIFQYIGTAVGAVSSAASLFMPGKVSSVGSTGVSSLYPGASVNYTYH